MSDALAAWRAPHRAAWPGAVDGLWVILHGLWVTAAVGRLHGGPLRRKSGNTVTAG
jgi:hypothetical protein